MGAGGDELYSTTNLKTLEDYAARRRYSSANEMGMRVALALEHVAAAIAQLATRRSADPCAPMSRAKPPAEVPCIVSVAQPGCMCRECRRFVPGGGNESQLCDRCKERKAKWERGEDPLAVYCPGCGVEGAVGDQVCSNCGQWHGQ